MDDRSRLRKRGEGTPSGEELLASYRHLASILESMLDAVIVANPDGTIRTVNPAALELLGYAEEEIIGQPVGTIFEEEEEEEEEEEAFFRGSGLAQLVREGAARDVELTLVAKSGERIPVVFNGSVIREEDGRLAAVVGVARDIRERLRAERELRESEQRFRDVARTTGDWIWEVDAEGRYTYASPVVEQVLGYTPEKVLGKHSYDFFHPDDREEFKTLAQETFQKKEPFVRLVNPNVHKDGRTVILETTGLPLTDAEGNLLGYRGADRDVTARVWREETLHALNAAAAAVQRAARTPEAVFTAVMEQLQALGLTGAVALLDEKREQFTIRYTAVSSQALARAEELVGLKAVGYPLPVEQLPIGRQILAGEAVFVPDIAALLAPVIPPPVRRLMPVAMRLLGMPWGVVASLSVQGEIIGFLGVSADRLTEADVPMVTAFANQMAAALENAQLFKAEQRRATQLETIGEVGQQITSLLELDTLLDRIVNLIHETFNYRYVTVLLLDPAAGELALRAGAGYDTEPAEPLRLRVGEEGICGWVAASGEPLLVDDVSQEPRYYPLEVLADTRSELAVPIQVKGRVIGVLDVQSAELGAFDEDDFFTLQTLADQVGVAIENARLYLVQKEEAEISETLLRVAATISSLTDPDELLKTTLKLAVELLKADRSIVWLWDERQGVFFPREVHGFSGPVSAGLKDLKLSPNEVPILGELLRHKAPVAVDDALHTTLIPQALVEAFEIKSILGVPVIYQEQLLGALGVSHAREAHCFTEKEIALATGIANQAAIAIENTRLFEAERGQRELAEALEEAAAAVSSTLDPDQVLDRILEQVERVVAGDAFNIMLIEDSTVRVVRWRRYERFGAGERIASFTIPVAEFPSLVKMARTGEPVVIPDTATDPAWVVTEGWEWERSYVGAPIRVGGVTVGVLNVDGIRPGQFGPADAQRLEAFADHAATAIENARLFEQSQREIAERKRAERLLQALNQAALAMERALTPEEIFAAIAEEIKKLDFRCVVFLTDESQKRLYPKYFTYEAAAIKAVQKLLGVKAEDFFIPIETIDVYGKVVWERKAIFAENAGDVVRQWLPEPAKRIAGQIVRTLKVPKAIDAPLIVEDKVIGVLSVQSDDLTEDDVPAITAFAHQMAAAWRKARLMQDLQISLAEVKRSQEELRHTAETLRRTLGATIQAMAFTVETRDPYTAGHQRQVANLARAMATEMGLSKEQVEGIRMAAVIHDIGKITAPTDILNKPTQLTEHEFGIIKSHPEVAYNILKTIEFPWPIAQIVFQHHERLDGSGYPQGLLGEEIILEARILAVADVVEAMASHRPYRAALGIDKALEEISQNRGVLYDPEVVDVCLRLFTEKRFKLG